MIPKPILARPPLVLSATAAILAPLIAIGIFAGVTHLMVHNGLPMEELVAAERACAAHAYVSERDTCVRRWHFALHAPRMASQ